MVFAQNLDIRRPRYRHSRAVGFRILAWALVYQFSSVFFFAEKKKRDEILVTNKSIVHYRCSVGQMEYLAQENIYAMSIHSDSRVFATCIR